MHVIGDCLRFVQVYAWLRDFHAYSGWNMVACTLTQYAVCNQITSRFDLQLTASVGAWQPAGDAVRHVCRSLMALWQADLSPIAAKFAAGVRLTGRDRSLQSAANAVESGDPSSLSKFCAM
jgi:hypothetical protein